MAKLLNSTRRKDNRVRLFEIVRRGASILTCQIGLIWRNWGCRIIIPCSGVGDVVCVATIIREFKSRCPTARFSIVIDGVKKSACQVAEIFADCFVHVDVHHYPKTLQNISLPSIYKLYPRICSLWCSAYGSVNFLDLMTQLLKCPFELKQAKPYYMDFSRNYVFDAAAHPQGQTVLLCPDAYSLSMQNLDTMWMALAEHLGQKGFTVVFNAKDDSRCKGYETIFYDIVNTCAFAEHCGFVIGLRSGLMDLMAYITNAKILSIYSRNLDDWDKILTSVWKEVGYREAGDDFLKYWSLSGLFDRQGLYDCFYDGLDDLLKRVDDLVSEESR